MSGLNKVMLIGRLGQDPEIKKLSNGQSVANFSVATSEKYKSKDGQQKEKTEWHRMVLYDKLADLAGQYLAKGSQAYFEGKLQTRSWEDKEGKKCYATEIVVRNMQFLEKKAEGSSTPEPGTPDFNSEEPIPF